MEARKVLTHWIAILVLEQAAAVMGQSGNARPTTLEGLFEPVMRRFDPSLHLGSNDLPMDHPRLKKNVTSLFPEQISLALSTDPSSMWVSWITGCMTFVFPCVTFGRIAVFADEGSSSCVAKGALYCLATALTGCFLGGACCCGCCNRGRLRKRLEWKQSACDDCCVHCCCHCCALCQEYRHLKSLDYDPSKGWDENRQMPSGAMGITQPPMMNNMSQQS